MLLSVLLWLLFDESEHRFWIMSNISHTQNTPHYLVVWYTLLLLSGCCCCLWFLSFFLSRTKTLRPTKKKTPTHSSSHPHKRAIFVTYTNCQYGDKTPPFQRETHTKIPRRWWYHKIPPPPPPHPPPHSMHSARVEVTNQSDNQPPPNIV